LDSGQFDEHNVKWEFQFFRQLVMEMTADRIFSEMEESTGYQGLFEDLKSRKIDPFSAAELLVKRLEYKHQ